MAEEKKTDSFIVILALAVIVLSVGILYIKNFRLTPIVNDVQRTVQDVVQKEVPTRFETESVWWQKGETNKVTVSFASLPATVPAAVTLQVKFDPTELAALSVVPGNLWADSNVLEEKIDNAAGTITYTLGQGFNSEATGGIEIAEISFKALADAEVKSTEIELGQDSVLAIPGENSTVNLEGVTLEVKVLE